MHVTKSREKSLMTYIGVLLIPTVILNSAYWAQCDAIYTAFIVLSLLFMMRESYHYSFIALGLAFAFKLQAIFILPFYVFYYLYKKKFSLLYFFYMPTCMVLSSVLGLVQGRAFGDIFRVYFWQTHAYKRMFLNYPNIWCFVNDTKKAAAASYDMLYIFAIGLTFTILAVLFYYVLKCKNLSKTSLLKLAFLTVYTCVLVLPAMHERYVYVCIILGFILMCIDFKQLPLFVFLVIIDLQTYSKYLFGMSVNYTVLAVFNIVIYILYLVDFLKGVGLIKYLEKKNEEQVG